MRLGGDRRENRTMRSLEHTAETLFRVRSETTEESHLSYGARTRAQTCRMSMETARRPVARQYRVRKKSG